MIESRSDARRDFGRDVDSPQGAVISPLLSNSYLHPLDLYWEREVKATKMVRYADDLVVLCR